jgi:transposase
MRLTEYGRNPKKRKAYEPQPALLLVGVDVSKAKHSACIGTQTAINCRKLAFPHPREGFRRFAQARREPWGHKHWRRLLLAMAPSGIYWPALYERLTSCGYGVCLVHCHAVRKHRTTMPEGARKTAEKDA